MMGANGCMARPERFELPTYSSGGCRSIQLSYGRAGKPHSVYIGFSAPANLPKLLRLIVEPQQPVARIVTLAAIGAGKIAPQMRAFAVVVFGDGKG